MPDNNNRGNHNNDKPSREGSRVMNMLEKMGYMRKIDHEEAPKEEPPSTSYTVGGDGLSTMPVEFGSIDEVSSLDLEPSYEEDEAPALSSNIEEDIYDSAPPDFSQNSDISVTEMTSEELPEMNTNTVGQNNNPEAVYNLYQQQQQQKHNPVSRTFENATYATKSHSNSIDLPDTDKYLDIHQLYERFQLRSSGTDTIYLVEEYMSTLPNNLPPEMKRSIVMKIISSSGFDFDVLLNDGIDRVTKLNQYSAAFTENTERIVAEYNQQIDGLRTQIEQLKGLIAARKNLHKTQFLALEIEAQRLKEVLDFITK